MDRNKTIKIIWIKAKELGLYNPSSLENEIKNSELYELIYRETKKDSMKKCTDDELKKILEILNFFDAQNKSKTGKLTQKQLEYIKYLTKELGWNESKRLNGFIKKYTGIEKLTWLNKKQASNIIEGLKNLLKKD